MVGARREQAPRRNEDDEPPPYGELAPERRRPRAVPRDSSATEALRLLIWTPDAIAPWLDESLFPDPVTATAFRSIATSESLLAAIELAAEEEPAAGALLQRLAVEEPTAEAADVLARLVEEAARSAMAALRAEAQVAADPLAIGETIGWLNLRIMELREPETQQVALDELLDWVIGDADGAEHSGTDEMAGE